MTDIYGDMPEHDKKVAQATLMSMLDSFCEASDRVMAGYYQYFEDAKFEDAIGCIGALELLFIQSRALLIEAELGESSYRGYAVSMVAKVMTVLERVKAHWAESGFPKTLTEPDED